MAIRTSIHAAALATLVIATGLAPSTPVLAAEARVPVLKVAASEGTSRFIPHGIGKSVAIDLPADIKDVLVADPKIANAVMRSSRRVYMIGVTVGQTNIFFFDADGKQIAGFDIAVTRDLNGVRAALKQMMPDADIRIEGVGDGVMLSGSSASAAESQQAYDLASRLVGDGTKVVNGIAVRGRDQVMLKVTIAEVQRQIIKQLGINLSGSAGYGSAVVNFNNTNPFPINGTPNSGIPNIGGTFKSVTANLQAMEQSGVIRILAEPTLTAISGETANFLAGGSFPYPTPPTIAGGAPRVCLSEFRCRPGVHSCGAVGRSRQPEGVDGSLRTFPRKFRDNGGNHGSRPEGAARRNDCGDFVRRLARPGRHDPGGDQTNDQRLPRPDAIAGAGHLVQEP